MTAQVEALTTKVTELPTQTAAVAATGQTGVPTYTHPDAPSCRCIPPDFTMGKTNIIDAWRIWHLGNKQCGADSNKPVCAYKDIPPEHLDGDKFKRTRRRMAVWSRVMHHLEAQLDNTPSPTHAWRTHSPTHHRTIMMLVAVIPKGVTTGKRTTRPSMNSVATVDKNLRIAKKEAEAAQLAGDGDDDLLGE